MLIKTEHWFVEIHWANSHTLTDTLRVVDFTSIAGLWKLSELEDWIISLQSQVTAWNLRIQLKQVLVLLQEMRGAPDGLASEDFMDELRKSISWSDYHPMGNERITANRKADSRVTTLDFAITISGKPVVVMFVLSQRADVLMSVPTPPPPALFSSVKDF